MYNDYRDTPKRREWLLNRDLELREMFADELNHWIEPFLATVPTETLEGWDDVNLSEAFTSWIAKQTDH